jgi:hypothetical protein
MSGQQVLSELNTSVFLRLYVLRIIGLGVLDCQHQISACMNLQILTRSLDLYQGFGIEKVAASMSSDRIPVQMFLFCRSLTQVRAKLSLWVGAGSDS